MGGNNVNDVNRRDSDSKMAGQRLFGQASLSLRLSRNGGIEGRQRKGGQRADTRVVISSQACSMEMCTERRRPSPNLKR